MMIVAREARAADACRLRSLELFSGAGGLALGVHRAGFRSSALLEWDRNACATLRENVRRKALPGVSDWGVIQGDVREASYERFGPIDLVAGGPPCQPFSIGGKHRGRRDDRDMIPEFVRAIRDLEPRAFLFENVKGLARAAFRDYFDYVRLRLANPGIRMDGLAWADHLARLRDVDQRGAVVRSRYRVAARLLNAADYGVPQRRERVFVVGFRSDVDVEWRFPRPTHSRRRLLHDQWVTGRYWDERNLERPAGVPQRFRAAVRGLRTTPPPTEAPWRTLRDGISDLPEPSPDGDPDVPNHRLRLGARSYPGHTGSPLDLPAKTLKAGVHGVPGGENMILFRDGSVRYLTVREAARVQTFPDEWRFEGSWSESMRQLGNAVAVDLAALLGRRIAEALAGRAG